MWTRKRLDSAFGRGAVIATVAALALAVAAGTHKLIENPIRFHPWLRAQAARSMALGAVLTASSLIASILCLKIADGIAR